MISNEQILQVRKVAENATAERCCPQLLLAVRGLLLGALEDIETLQCWHVETCAFLGHRTNQVADLEDALDEYANGWRPDPDEARHDARNLPRLLTNLTQILRDQGPLSSYSRAELDALAAEQSQPRVIGGGSELWRACTTIPEVARG